MQRAKGGDKVGHVEVGVVIDAAEIRHSARRSPHPPGVRLVHGDVAAAIVDLWQMDHVAVMGGLGEDVCVDGRAKPLRADCITHGRRIRIPSRPRPDCVTPNAAVRWYVHPQGARHLPEGANLRGRTSMSEPIAQPLQAP